MIITNNAITYTAAGGVVVDPRSGDILLLVRPARDEIRLPKGHVDEGESLTQTALREVHEESGYADVEIIADLGEQLVAFVYQERAIQRTEHYYLMQARSLATGEQPDHDAAQFIAVWVPWEEALANVTFDAEREWLHRARRAWEEYGGAE